VYFETPLKVVVSKDFLMQNFAMKILNFEPQIYSRAEKLYNHIGKKTSEKEDNHFGTEGVSFYSGNGIQDPKSL
jgi:hypothetical protein